MLAISTPPQSLHPPLGSRGICTHFSCVSLFVWSDRLKAQTPRSDNSLPWQISTGRCRSRFKSQCFFYSTHFGLMFLWSLYNAPLYCVFFPNGVINPNTTFPAVPYSFKLSFNKFKYKERGVSLEVFLWFPSVGSVLHNIIKQTSFTDSFQPWAVWVCPAY